MSTPSEKREMMEQKRKNWMKDRDLNIIQSQCYDEIKKNNNAIGSRNHLSSSINNKNNDNFKKNSTVFQTQEEKEMLRGFENAFQPLDITIVPEQQDVEEERNKQNELFLSMMTDKLSTKIRTETRKEFLSKNENSEWIKEKMDQYLEGELSTHTCKICFELMIVPIHTPILLFPCGGFNLLYLFMIYTYFILFLGHTFCTSCVDSHLNDKRETKRNDSIKDLNKHCPYCRSLIHSKAINLSLKDLIEQFSMQRKNIETGIDYDNNQKNFQVDTNLQMMEKYKSCKMRKRYYIIIYNLYS
jgi:hypothetical protein